MADKYRRILMPLGLLLLAWGALEYYELRSERLVALSYAVGAISTNPEIKAEFGDIQKLNLFELDGDDLEGDRVYRLVYEIKFSKASSIVHIIIRLHNGNWVTQSLIVGDNNQTYHRIIGSE